ncbi:hypothetical protein Trydic_g21932 [Trypoxylus dichotomus]
MNATNTISLFISASSHKLSFLNGRVSFSKKIIVASVQEEMEKTTEGRNRVPSSKSTYRRLRTFLSYLNGKTFYQGEEKAVRDMALTLWYLKERSAAQCSATLGGFVGSTGKIPRCPHRSCQREISRSSHDQLAVFKNFVADRIPVFYAVTQDGGASGLEVTKTVCQWEQQNAEVL